MSLSAIPSQIILQTGNGQNFLTWNIVAGAVSYTVQRSLDQISWSTIGTPSITSYLDSNVIIGTNYFYRVGSSYITSQASATMTLTGEPTSGNTFIIANITITAGTSFAIGGSTTITAANIAAAINSNGSFAGIVSAVALGPVITFTSSMNGPEGTGIQFSNALVNATITPFVIGTGLITSNYGNSFPTSIAPCAPGQINLGYLRYQAKLRADMLNSNFVTSDEWNFMINNSVMELYDLLVTKFGEDYFLAPPLVIQSNSALSYPLPNGTNYPNINGIPNPGGPPAPACYKVYSVDFNSFGAQLNNSQGWVSMSRFNWADHNKYNILLGAASNNVSGQYCSFQYREMGDQIFIIPSNSGQYFRLWYVPLNKQLLADTDMMPFGYSAWYEYAVVDAASKALAKQQLFDQAQELMNRKMALEVRIETTAANRDVGSPNTATNSRGTMGDPNFSGPGFGGSGFGGGFGNGFGY